MALEIKRRPDGGITLCTNVCTMLTPADVAMLDKQARAYHGKLHGGTSAGSALGPDIIGDDEGPSDNIITKGVKAAVVYPVKGAWWVTKSVGKGVGKGVTSLFSGSGERFFGHEVGLPLQRRGGHVEIMGPVSNREFMRERGHMGGFYEQTKERFPAKMGKSVGPQPTRTPFCFHGLRVYLGAITRRPFIKRHGIVKVLSRAAWATAQKAGPC